MHAEQRSRQQYAHQGRRVQLPQVMDVSALDEVLGFDVPRRPRTCGTRPRVFGPEDLWFLSSCKNPTRNVSPAPEPDDDEEALVAAALFDLANAAAVPEVRGGPGPAAPSYAKRNGAAYHHPVSNGRSTGSGYAGWFTGTGAAKRRRSPEDDLYAEEEDVDDFDTGQSQEEPYGPADVQYQAPPRRRGAGASNGRGGLAALHSLQPHQQHALSNGRFHHYHQQQPGEARAGRGTGRSGRGNHLAAEDPYGSKRPATMPGGGGGRAANGGGEYGTPNYAQYGHTSLAEARAAAKAAGYPTVAERHPNGSRVGAGAHSDAPTAAVLAGGSGRGGAAEGPADAAVKSEALDGAGPGPGPESAQERWEPSGVEPGAREKPGSGDAAWQRQARGEGPLERAATGSGNVDRGPAVAAGHLGLTVPRGSGAAGARSEANGSTPVSPSDGGNGVRGSNVKAETSGGGPGSGPQPAPAAAPGPDLLGGAAGSGRLAGLPPPQLAELLGAAGDAAIGPWGPFAGLLPGGGAPWGPQHLADASKAAAMSAGAGPGAATAGPAPPPGAPLVPGMGPGPHPHTQLHQLQQLHMQHQQAALKAAAAAAGVGGGPGAAMMAAGLPPGSLEYLRALHASGAAAAVLSGQPLAVQAAAAAAAAAGAVGGAGAATLAVQGLSGAMAGVAPPPGATAPAAPPVSGHGAAGGAPRGATMPLKRCAQHVYIAHFIARQQQQLQQQRQQRQERQQQSQQQQAQASGGGSSNGRAYSEPCRAAGGDGTSGRPSTTVGREGSTGVDGGSPSSGGTSAGGGDGGGGGGDGPALPQQHQQRHRSPQCATSADATPPGSIGPTVNVGRGPGGGPDGATAASGGGGPGGGAKHSHASGSRAEADVSGRPPSPTAAAAGRAVLSHQQLQQQQQQENHASGAGGPPPTAAGPSHGSAAPLQQPPGYALPYPFAVTLLAAAAAGAIPSIPKELGMAAATAAAATASLGMSEEARNEVVQKTLSGLVQASCPHLTGLLQASPPQPAPPAGPAPPPPLGVAPPPPSVAFAQMLMAGPQAGAPGPVAAVPPATAGYGLPAFMPGLAGAFGAPGAAAAPPPSAVAAAMAGFPPGNPAAAAAVLNAAAAAAAGGVLPPGAAAPGASLAAAAPPLPPFFGGGLPPHFVGPPGGPLVPGPGGLVLPPHLGQGPAAAHHHHLLAAAAWQQQQQQQGQ